MTNEKIHEVLNLYENWLREAGYEAAEFPLDADPLADDDGGFDNQLAHVRAMLPKMRVFLAEGRREKLMRWLGFVQGVLFADGVFTLEQLMSHVKPDEVLFDATR